MGAHYLSTGNRVVLDTIHSFGSVRVLSKREVYCIGRGRKDPGARATAQG